MQPTQAEYKIKWDLKEGEDVCIIEKNYNIWIHPGNYTHQLKKRSSLKIPLIASK